MKNAISCYIQMNDSEYEELSKNATLVFDTNVLLNLYKCSENTRNALIALLKDVSSRLWIPYHIAYEFGKNRIGVIYETVDKYDKINGEIKKFYDFIRKELSLSKNDKEVDELYKFLFDWIKRYKEANLKTISADDDKIILPAILDMYEGKVGRSFDKQELDEISKEGKLRYEAKVPPGNKDGKKDNGNEYGDLIVWKQIIEYAKQNNKDVIFITADQKEDWWDKVTYRIIGPKSELRIEFSEQTKRKFHMYTMERFLDLILSTHGKRIDQDVIDEVRQISQTAQKEHSTENNNDD